MPRKVFTAGEVLAATDVNNFLMDQTVMVFAGTAARGSAIGTATEGMYTHLNDTDALQYYNGSAWVSRIPTPTPSAILQVKGTAISAVFSSSRAGGAAIAVTGLTDSITPSSTASKVLVTLDISGGSNDGAGWAVILKRGGTAVGIGDAEGSRTRVTSGGAATTANRLQSAGFTFLDSPASVSSQTYTVEIVNMTDVTAILYVNRSSTDLNNSSGGRSASRLTLMEVAG
jgi:hypothetical protein